MLLGHRIGPFRVEKELGGGAMGTVYLAVHGETGQRVAIKIVAPGLAGNETSLLRFKREVQILKQLEHPNIVRFVASGKISGTPFYAMEYIEGEPLDAILERRKRLPWKEVVTLGRQLCAALLHAHHQGIVHRDLKPSNLMILKDGTLKLTDFGIAKDLDLTALTAANRTVGTASYMSPEQCKGEKSITHKSDLYSMGIVFYELLTGRKPFHAETVMEMFNMHISASFERPSRIVMDIPIWLDTLVTQLLEKDPEKRPYDAEMVARALKEIEEKAETQMSAALARSKARPVDRTDLMPSLDETDREILKTLTGKDKKKRKKKKASARARWIQAGASGVALLVIVYVLFTAFFKAPSAESLYSRAESLMKSESLQERREARREPIKEFLRYYPTHPKAKQIQAWADQFDLEQGEQWADLFLKKRREPIEDSERTLVKALDLEREGKLRDAGEQWAKLVSLKQKDDDERPFGLLAEKYQNDYDAVFKLPDKLKADVILGKNKGRSELESLALKAAEKELIDKKPKEARELWENLKKSAKEPEGDARPWYLLGAWKYLELSEKKK